MKTFTIRIDYQLVDSSEWCQIHLSPEQYFDLEVGEELSIGESVARFNHAIEYLDIPLEKLRATRLVVEDGEAGKRREISESYWKNGRNSLIERRDFLHDKETYYEMIQEIHMAENPPTWEIIRVIREDNILQPIFHSRIVTNPDGSERETILLSISKRKGSSY